MTYPTEWTCESTGSSTDCTVLATSTDMTSPTYNDWIFVQMWIIFMLTLLVAGFFFKGFKRGKSIT